MVDKNSRWRPFCGVLNSKTIQYAYTCRAYYLTLVYLIMRSFKMYDWRMNNLFSDTVCTHCTVHNSAAMPGCVFFHLRFQPIVGDYISMQFGKRSKQTPTSIEAKSKSTVTHPAQPTDRHWQRHQYLLNQLDTSASSHLEYEFMLILI